MAGYRGQETGIDLICIQTIHQFIIIYIKMHKSLEIIPRYKYVFVSSFALEQSIFQRYFCNLVDSIRQHQNLFEKILFLQSQGFTSELLKDSRNIGVCLCPIGMLECISLNKEKGIRAAVVHNQYIAEMCKKHNDANVCIIGTDCIAEKLASQLINTFLVNEFDHEERNMIRVNKIKEFDQ